MKKLLISLLMRCNMFTVNYFAINFGFVGSDTFHDDKIKDALDPIVKKLSEQLGERVYYRIIN